MISRKTAHIYHNSQICFYFFPFWITFSVVCFVFKEIVQYLVVTTIILWHVASWHIVNHCGCCVKIILFFSSFFFCTFYYFNSVSVFLFFLWRSNYFRFRIWYTSWGEKPQKKTQVIYFLSTYLLNAHTKVHNISHLFPRCSAKAISKAQIQIFMLIVHQNKKCQQIFRMV